MATCPCDPELRDEVEATAKYVGTHGACFERMLMALYPFLESSDPNHAYYQHMLSEYRAQHHVSPPDSPVADDDAPPLDTGVSIFTCPDGTSPKEFAVMKLTAQFVVRFGYDFWSALQEIATRNTALDFMQPSDDRFKRLLCLVDVYELVLDPCLKPGVYTSAIIGAFFNILKEEGMSVGAHMIDLGLEFVASVAYRACSSHLHGQLSRQLQSGKPDPQPILLVSKPLGPLYYPFPLLGEEITAKEFGIVKLTCLFESWFGSTFLDALEDKVAQDPRFEFLKDNARYCLSNRVSGGYANVVRPFEKPRKAWMETVLDGFFNLIKQGSNQEEGWKLGYVGPFDFFVYMEYDQFPQPESMSTTQFQAAVTLSAPTASQLSHLLAPLGGMSSTSAST